MAKHSFKILLLILCLNSYLFLRNPYNYNIYLTSIVALTFIEFIFYGRYNIKEETNE